MKNEKKKIEKKRKKEENQLDNISSKRLINTKSK
jgi:hypothetical protein